MRCIAALLFVAFNTASATEPVVKPNERIVFFGDSITFFGDLPRGYVAHIRSTLSEKGMGIEVRGAGIPGTR